MNNYTFCLSKEYEVQEGEEVPRGCGVIAEVCGYHSTYDGTSSKTYCLEILPEEDFYDRVPVMKEEITECNVTGSEYTETETCDEYFITFQDLKILSEKKENERWDYIIETRKKRFGEACVRGNYIIETRKRRLEAAWVRGPDEEEAGSCSGSLRAFREATRAASREASVKAEAARAASREASVKAEAARAAFKAKLDEATKTSL